MERVISRIAPSAKFLKSIRPGVGSSPATALWTPDTDDEETVSSVRNMINAIQTGGERACLEYARKLDGWTKPTVLLTEDEIHAQISSVSEEVRDDVQFQNERVRNFALAQRASLHDVEVELFPGLITGQRVIPVSTAGCYVPGGRFSHVSSAIMTVTTAKAAGVEHVIAACPPQAGTDTIHPATLYALQLAGAHI